MSHDAAPDSLERDNRNDSRKLATKAAAQGLRGEEANSADQLQYGCALRAIGNECYGVRPLTKGGHREEIT
jgi:hypothetical protein